MLRSLSTVRYAGQVCVLAFVIIISSGTSSQITGFGYKENDSLLGNYLAGRFATVNRDNKAAAQFYRRALRKDASNKVLLEQSFLLEINGRAWRKATDLARRLLRYEPNHYTARLFLGSVALKAKRYRRAKLHFSKAGKGAIPQLTTELALAWTKIAQNKPEEALATIQLNNKKNANWLQLYRRYHNALIADVAGKHDIASRDYAYIFDKDQKALRIAISHTHHALQLGKYEKAKQILDAYSKESKGNLHPFVTDLYQQVEAKQKPGFVVTSATAGLAEVFYGLGDALSSDGGVDYGAIYLKMALFLKPDMELVHVSLASIYERTKKYDLAIQIYSKIKKDSPLWPRVQLRKALNFNYIDKVDQATDLLKDMIKKRPGDMEPVETLGNILRVRKRFQEALKYYDIAVKNIQTPTRENWVQYYHRGISYERLNKWDKAEKDLQKSLELDPNQALVLNYLGYSWVDQNRNLDEAMELIRKAVKLRPNDGYIVDSLGWAYYRLGNFQNAVKHLEKAVSLKPDDPVINDHLGDAYWRVGRKLEAEYQWSQALSLKPEEKEIANIKDKLKHGLPDVKVTDEARLEAAGPSSVNK